MRALTWTILSMLHSRFHFLSCKYHFFCTSETYFSILTLAILNNSLLCTSCLYLKITSCGASMILCFQFEFFIFFTLIEISSVSVSLFRISETCFSNFTLTNLGDSFVVHLLILPEKIPSCGASTHFLKKIFSLFMAQFEISNVSSFIFLCFRNNFFEI